MKLQKCAATKNEHIQNFRISKKNRRQKSMDQNFRISKKKHEIVNPRWAPRNAPPRKMNISKILGFPKKTDAKKVWTKILGFQQKKT